MKIFTYCPAGGVWGKFYYTGDSLSKALEYFKGYVAFYRDDCIEIEAGGRIVRTLSFDGAAWQ